MAGHTLKPTPMPDARFNACMPFTAVEEGGDSDDAHDSGGFTSRGITHENYAEWRTKKGLPQQSAALATDDEITRIYYEEYWLPNCPKMPPGVDLVYFDTNVNAGHHATVLLQRALNIQQASDEFKSGHETIGPVTLAALARVNPAAFVNKLSDTRLAWYESLSDFQYFGAGWSARTKRIQAAAFKMASIAPAPTPAKPTEKPMPTPPVTTQITTPLPGVAHLGSSVSSFSDILKQIEGGLSLAKTGLPVLATFWAPARYAVALLPVVDEGLGLLEDIQSKSGQDLFAAIGQRIQAIGAHVQTAAPNLQAAASSQPASSGPGNTSGSVPIG